MTHNLQKQHFTARLWQEDGWIVAQCLEIDIASQGKTQQKALDNLREALELHFEPPCATFLTPKGCEDYRNRIIKQS